MDLAVAAHTIRLGPFTAHTIRLGFFSKAEYHHHQHQRQRQHHHQHHRQNRHQRHKKKTLHFRQFVLPDAPVEAAICIFLQYFKKKVRMVVWYSTVTVLVQYYTRIGTGTVQFEISIVLPY